MPCLDVSPRGEGQTSEWKISVGLNIATPECLRPEGCTQISWILEALSSRLTSSLFSFLKSLSVFAWVSVIPRMPALCTVHNQGLHLWAQVQSMSLGKAKAYSRGQNSTPLFTI